MKAEITGIHEPGSFEPTVPSIGLPYILVRFNNIPEYASDPSLGLDVTVELEGWDSDAGLALLAGSLRSIAETVDPYEDDDEDEDG